jgi:hypothetical protein
MATSVKPRFSQRPMMSCTTPRATPSGLTMRKVRSIAVPGLPCSGTADAHSAGVRAPGSASSAAAPRAAAAPALYHVPAHGCG